MKAKSFDGDFFHALVLFQVKAVAFVATARSKNERAMRAKRLTQTLERLSVLDFKHFHAALKGRALIEGGCPCGDGYVCCHGVCMPEESCYGYLEAQSVPMAAGAPAKAKRSK
jgi:hypothetical protein